MAVTVREWGSGCARLRLMRIGILGGTGPAGSALAARLASVGYDVVIGSRSKYRAMEARDGLIVKWPDLAARLGSGDNAAAVRVRPRRHRHAVGLGGHHRAGERGRARRQGRHQHGQHAGARRPRVPAAGPAARQRGRARAGGRAAVPRRRRVPPPAGQGARPPRRADRQRRAHLRRRRGRGADRQRDRRAIPGCRPLDAGELSNATAIEAFTAVLLQLNVRYKTRVAPKLTGIKIKPTPSTAPAPQPEADGTVLKPTDDAALRHGPPGGGAVRAGPARVDVHVRHHAVRRHPPRACGDVHVLRRPATSPDRPRSHGQVRAQRHRRRRPVVRQGPRARRALPRPGGGGGGSLQPRHGRRSTSCRSPHAARVVGDPRHPRVHRHGARPPASPTRPAARCTSTSPSSRRSARSATTRTSR